MSDLILRVVVVAVALVIIGLAIALRPRVGERRATDSIRLDEVGIDGLVDGPGIVLFASTSCGTCEEARAVVERVCGAEGYREVSWERHADALIKAGIDEVPLTVAVNRHHTPTMILRGTPSPTSVRTARRRAK